MRVVAYLRVSTARQAEEGLGLAVQEHTIRDWARAHGHRLVAVHRDEGVSGTNRLEDRTGLADALEVLRCGDAGGLVVYRLDRLARDLVLQEQLLREIWNLPLRLGGRGAEVFSTAGGESNLRDDPDDPSRRLIRQVLGAVNEYERAIITLRLRAGRRRKHERGGYAYGAPPYGWRAEEGELVPVPDQQAVIQRVRTLRAAGASLPTIARTLNDAGHPTRRGARWHPSSVARLLDGATG